MSDIIIDASSNDAGDGIMIDASGNNNSVSRVNLSSIGNKTSGHKVVRQQPHDQKPSTSNSTKTVVLGKNSAKPAAPKMNVTRKKVSIDAMGLPAGEQEDKSDIHESLEKDILDLDNPDSPFMQYVKEKDEEAREWIAEKEEEAALKREEEYEDEDPDDEEDEGLTIDLTSGDDDEDLDEPATYTETPDDIEIEEIDISEVDDETEDTEIMSNNIEKDEVLEEVEIDEGIDKDDLPDASDYEMNEEDEAAVEEFEDEESEDEEGPVAEEFEDEEPEDNEEGPVAYVTNVKPKEEPKKEVPAPKKEELLDAPDIDIEEDEEDIDIVKDIEEEEDPSTAVGEVDNDQVLKHLQKMAMEKMRPVSTRLDLSTFTIVKKPVANVNPIFQDSKDRVIKWVLPAQKSIVLMREFNGSEIEKLREYSENSGSIDSLNRRFKMIYDHISSPKPDSFETWLKTTPFEDVDHYFFAIYIACFKGANFLPGDCINKDCGETYITDDTKIMDMVKFDNKEAKQLFTELYTSEATPAGKGIYCTEVVPLSNKVAIAFRQPSIYNIFETSILSDRDNSRFASIVNYVPFIDTIYMIDQQNQALIPITYKMYPDNQVKTLRSKLMKYDKVFSSLSVDEFGPIRAYVEELSRKTTENSGMKYVLPASECPKCHHMTEEHVVSAEELVFTRYQLGALVTTSLS